MNIAKLPHTVTNYLYEDYTMMTTIRLNISNQRYRE